MATLNLTNPFTITIDDGETTKDLKGTFRDFTRQEKEDFEQKHHDAHVQVKKSQSLVRKIEQLQRIVSLKEKQEDYEGQEMAMQELSSLVEELEAATEKVVFGANDDTLLRERFDVCLGGEDRELIIEIAETVGYAKVYHTITEAISEHVAGKSKK